MDKVRKPSNSVCYTPSSEPYRIYLVYITSNIQTVELPAIFQSSRENPLLSPSSFTSGFRECSWPGLNFKPISLNGQYLPLVWWMVVLLFLLRPFFILCLTMVLYHLIIFYIEYISSPLFHYFSLHSLNDLEIWFLWIGHLSCLSFFPTYASPPYTTIHEFRKMTSFSPYLPEEIINSVIRYKQNLRINS
jgi:hypothetical protein